MLQETFTVCVKTLFHPLSYLTEESYGTLRQLISGRKFDPGT